MWDLITFGLLVGKCKGPLTVVVEGFGIWGLAFGNSMFGFQGHNHARAVTHFNSLQDTETPSDRKRP